MVLSERVTYCGVGKFVGEYVFLTGRIHNSREGTWLRSMSVGR